jgi:hypothetical protein
MGRTQTATFKYLKAEEFAHNPNHTPQSRGGH